MDLAEYLHAVMNEGGVVQGHQGAKRLHAGTLFKWATILTLYNPRRGPGN
jgi:hypothetical protein